MEKIQKTSELTLKNSKSKLVKAIGGNAILNLSLSVIRLILNKPSQDRSKDDIKIILDYFEKKPFWMKLRLDKERKET